jgi:hypothetical protein
MYIWPYMQELFVSPTLNKLWYAGGGAEEAIVHR